MTLTRKGIVLAGALFVATGALAQDAEHGAEYYAQYCATCHGMSGTGDGPLTEMMTTAVPDLTKMAANNDGEFPMLKVIHIIDGRTGVRAHGGPMPVYGALFKKESGSESPYADVLYSRGKVLSIAYYLEQIQE